MNLVTYLISRTPARRFIPGPRKYEFSFRKSGRIPLLHEKTVDDYPTLRWFNSFLKRSGTALLNNFAVSLSRENIRSYPEQVRDFSLSVLAFDFEGADAVFTPPVQKKVTRESIDDLYCVIPTPDKSLNMITSDRYFDRMFSAGPGMEVVSSLDENDMDLLRSRGLPTEGVRYLKADYRPFEKILRRKGEVFYFPVVFLRVTGDDLPEAVLISPEPGTFVSRLDGEWNWKCAKATLAPIMGITCHLLNHLAESHLVLDITTATFLKSFPGKHPLRRWMAEHFENTLHINDIGVPILFKEGGYLDSLFPVDYRDLVAMVEERVANLNVSSDLDFPKVLKKRGLEASGGHYPYVKYGMWYWDIIRSFVSRMVDDIYPSKGGDHSLDPCLEIWQRELHALDQHISLFKDVDVTTKKGLKNFLTITIFTAAVKHSVIAGSIKKETYYPRSFPLEQAKALNFSAVLTEKDFKESLPSLEKCLKQIQTTLILGGYDFQKLMEIDKKLEKHHPRAIADLRKNLAALDSAIEKDAKAGRAESSLFSSSKIFKSIQS